MPPVPGRRVVSPVIEAFSNGHLRSVLGAAQSTEPHDPPISQHDVEPFFDRNHAAPLFSARPRLYGGENFVVPNFINFDHWTSGDNGSSARGFPRELLHWLLL